MTVPYYPFMRQPVNLMPKKDPVLFSLQPLRNRGMFQAIRGMMRNNKAYILLKLTRPLECNHPK